MKLVILFSAMLLSATTYAADARFSFSAAKAAFATGTSPTGEQAEGIWVNVGNVILSSVDQTGAGYWPDGKKPWKGHKGLYEELVTLTTEDDAFGSTTVSSSSKLVSVETGKVYLKDGPVNWNIESTGMTRYVSGGSSTCAVVDECRILPSNGMLLCSRRVAADGCTLPNHRTFQYYGYNKRAAN